MSVRTFLAIIYQRKFIILGTLLTVVGVAYFGSLAIPPIYQANTKLQVATAPRGSLDFIDYNLDYTDRLMNTYIHKAQSGPVLGQLVQQFQLQAAPTIDVAIIPNTELIQLAVEAANPVLASDLANALAHILVAENEQTIGQREQQARTDLEVQVASVKSALAEAQQNYNQLLTAVPRAAEKIITVSRDIDQQQTLYGSLQQQLEELRLREIFQRNLLSIVDPATPPQQPLYPNLRLNLLLGLALGLIGGIGVAFLSEHLDDRLRSRAQVEDLTQTIILGELPRVRQLRPTLFFKEFGALSNAFLHLYTNLQARTDTSLPNVLLVTSTMPNEGKSTIVTGLAYLLAKGGNRVTVVDCNLRQPQLHEHFNLANSSGLSNLLQNQADLAQATCSTITPYLKVIPSGTSAEGDLLAFHYQGFAALLQQLKQQSDIILLDGPSFQVAPEIGTLLALSDGIILVINPQQVRQDALYTTSHTLHQLSANLIGAIINGVEATGAYAQRTIRPFPPPLLEPPILEPQPFPAPNPGFIQPALGKKS